MMPDCKEAVTGAPVIGISALFGQSISPCPPRSNNNDNNYKLVRDSALSVAVRDGAVPETSGAYLSVQQRGHGKLSRIAHFQRLESARKQPGNCGRCGKPNGNGYANCDRCRNYQTLYKLRKRNERLEQPSEVMKELAQFRRELTALRKMVKTMARARRESYLRGFMAGQRNYRRNRNKHLKRYSDAYPEISKQELAQISHAYADGWRE